MKKPVTLKDIARELGVHHTTVSLALRNSQLIKDSTRRRIQSHARKMGYHPNRLAQGLRMRRSDTIGVMVPEVNHHFFSQFISKITEFAFASGYSVMVFQSNDQLATEKRNIESLIDNRVAGVIASISLEARNSKHFKIFEQEGIPLIFFDRIPNDFKGIKVVVNNYQGAFDAAELMLKRGRKKIAFITGYSQLNVFRERLKGYKDAMKHNGLLVDEDMILKSGYLMMHGAKAAKKLKLLHTDLDGILAINDQIAVGAIKYLKRAGVNIPEDISIVGFDNAPIGLAVEPELTTFNQPIEKMAETTLNALLRQLDSKSKIIKEYKLTGDIIERNSIG
jgi:LacI family transcriptional regulator